MSGALANSDLIWRRSAMVIGRRHREEMPTLRLMLVVVSVAGKLCHRTEVQKVEYLWILPKYEQGVESAIACD